MSLINVSCRMALSGKNRQLAGLSSCTTVGQLASLLGSGPIAVCMRGSLAVYKEHSEQPFLTFSAADGVDEGVEVDIVAVTEDWPNPTKRMLWKDIELSRDDFKDSGLLHALLALGTGSAWDGVRAATRVNETCSFVIDGTYIFFELRRMCDVWFAYLGNLEIGGVAVTPRSIWLHADIHTALQPVEPGRNFTLPIIAAQYTSMYLRFEVDPSTLCTGEGRALSVAFDAVVAMARAGPRNAISQTEHVSSTQGCGWALAGGCVVWTTQDPCFLDAQVSVLGADMFSTPAPHVYEYSLKTVESSGGASFEESNSQVDKGHTWHSARCVYRGLNVVRTELNVVRTEKAGAANHPWHFRLVARALRSPLHHDLRK